MISNLVSNTLFIEIISLRNPLQVLLLILSELISIPSAIIRKALAEIISGEIIILEAKFGDYPSNNQINPKQQYEKFIQINVKFNKNNVCSMLDILSFFLQMISATLPTITI